MKLLIITQSIDINNPLLGFFHRWVEEFSKNFESIVVVCLEKGEYNLPQNVKVLSLGKEKGKSKIKYLYRFYKYIWEERQNYDNVFVHMNQEYVLFGYKVWWFLNKKIFMWRNHYEGNLLTRLSVFMCSKVFCTSRYSYTAKYKKTLLMPVGIDTDFFKPDLSLEKKSKSILFLGRISPSKKAHILIEALKTPKLLNHDFSVSFYGNPQPQHLAYYEGLKDMVKNYDLSHKVFFYKGITNEEALKIYNQHKIFINLSPDGMLDKTIFEAMACGNIVLSSNKNLIGKINNLFIFKKGDLTDIADCILKSLFLDTDIKKTEIDKNRNFVVSEHSLKKLSLELKKNYESIK